MASIYKLKEERGKIEKEISELDLRISKIDDAHDKDDKLSWTRDDEIAELYKQREKKQLRLQEIYKELGE